MQKFFLIVSCVYLTACGTSTPGKGDLAKLGATECFWPPDMVPHPHPPSQPSKDDEMA